MNKRGLILDNIPNMLTISRIILTFVVMYMIFTDVPIINTIVVFGIAAFTDFLDGKLARWFKWESEFGRKADMIADRFLWIGTALAFIVYYGLFGAIGWKEGLLLMLIMTRELICAPFAIIAFFSGSHLPDARYVAKVTTFVQGFALPSLILGVYYPIFKWITLPLAIICAITGFWSALYYMQDTKAFDEKQSKKKKR